MRLLLATSCAGPVDPKAGRWLIARAVDTGAEVFRGRLPDDCDPDSIGEVAGLIVVRADGFGGNDRLVVVSQGAYGNFIELLSLESGPSAFRVLVGE